MRAIHCAIGLVVTMTAFSASADDWIIFGQKESGMLTAAEIFLRNQSYNQLNFYAASGPEGWEEFVIAAGDTALIKRSKVTIAISTARSDTDPEADAPPSLSPSDAIAESAPGMPVEHGVYTIAHFTGGQHALFCWSKANKRWIVGALDLLKC